MVLTNESTGPVRENAARLRCARKSQALSVSKACAALGIAPATLKRWEAGNGTPGGATIEKIFNAWGLSTDSALRTEVAGESFGRKVSWSIEQSEPRPVLRLLRHKRRRCRLSLEDVSEATGVGVASLQRYETGLRVPNAGTLESLTAAVGCTSQEAHLLCQSLASTEPSSTPLEIARIFSRPEANPGFWIFRELDFICRFHTHQTREEVDNRLRSILLGLAFTGDYSALLEAWQSGRALGSKPRNVNLVQGIVAMAKMHLARRPREAMAEFVSVRKQIPALPRTPDEVNATFSAIRMAQMLGEHEDADDMLSRVENEFEFHDSGKISCAVYRHLIDFSIEGATDSIEGLQNVRKDADPVLSYTTLVAELNILSKMGNRLAAMDTLQQCRSAEETYGLGSPLARKLGLSLSVA